MDRKASRVILNPCDVWDLLLVAAQGDWAEGGWGRRRGAPLSYCSVVSASD